MLKLVKDKNTPPLNWTLGRIVELLHPGADDITDLLLCERLRSHSLSCICPWRDCLDLVLGVINSDIGNFYTQHN